MGNIWTNIVDKFFPFKLFEIEKMIETKSYNSDWWALTVCTAHTMQWQQKWRRARDPIKRQVFTGFYMEVVEGNVSENGRVRTSKKSYVP